MKRSLVTLLLAGCSTRPTAPPPAVEIPAVPVVVADLPEVVEGAESPDALEVLLATAGEVDSAPGLEDVMLLRDGTLAIGTATTTVELVTSEYAWPQQADLRVAPIDGGQNAVLLVTPTAETEDPPNRYRLFLYDGSHISTAFDMVIGTYGVTPLVLLGDGTARFVEDGWTACMRASSPPTPVPRQEVVYRLDAARRMMTEDSRADTAALQHCDRLAACPFVDVMGEDGPKRVGEILRNLRGAEASTHQSLALGPTPTPLELRISEEKAEVTHIDALWVESDGQRLSPRACAAAQSPSFCAADGQMFVLREGESIALGFDTPASGAAELHAIGYYTPTPMGCF